MRSQTDLPNVGEGQGEEAKCLVSPETKSMVSAVPIADRNKTQKSLRMTLILDPEKVNLEVGVAVDEEAHKEEEEEEEEEREAAEEGPAGEGEPSGLESRGVSTRGARHDSGIYLLDYLAFI